MRVGVRRLRWFLLASLPVLLSGCKGLGALFKVLAVAAYVTVRVAAAAAASGHHSSSSSSSEDPGATSSARRSSGPTNATETISCKCPYVEHGTMSCVEPDVCRLSCEEGWVFREGTCVPGERPERIENYP